MKTIEQLYRFCLLVFSHLFVMLFRPGDRNGSLQHSSQAATCYYQFNHSKVEAIPLSALPKNTTNKFARFFLFVLTRCCRLCVCHTTPTQKLFCLLVFHQAGPLQRVDCLATSWKIISQIVFYTISSMLNDKQRSYE